MSSLSNDIFFIGLPGSGKSTLGMLLAQEWQWPFVDLDQYIEERTQQTVADIFTHYGEAHFRDLEFKYLRELASGKGSKVIATGGGTPCFHGNMDYILKRGTVIFLDVPVPVLADRLSNQGTFQRPLLQGKDREALIQQLENSYRQRLPYFSRATAIFKGSDIGLEQILSEITR